MSCHSLDKKSEIDSTSIFLIRIVLLKPYTCEKNQMSATVASCMEEEQWEASVHWPDWRLADVQVILGTESGVAEITARTSATALR